MKVSIAYTIHLESDEMQTVREALGGEFTDNSRETSKRSYLLSNIDATAIDAAHGILESHGYHKINTNPKCYRKSTTSLGDPIESDSKKKF